MNESEDGKTLFLKNFAVHGQGCYRYVCFVETFDVSLVGLRRSLITGAKVEASTVPSRGEPRHSLTRVEGHIRNEQHMRTDVETT